MVKVRLSEDPRDFLRRDWSALVRLDPAGTFFHLPGYLKLYWEEFGQSSDHLLLAFVEEGEGEPVGVCAFERIGETLRFLGGTEVTDYLGPVARPERAQAVAEALWDALLGMDAWRHADLRGLPEDRAWLRLLREGARARGLLVLEDDDPNGAAPYVALPGSWDAYLAALPAKHRHEIRRKANKLRAEAGDYRVVAADEGTLGPMLDRFVELHRQSEGPKGVFMVPGMEIFFRRLGEAFCAEGRFRLTFLELQGSLVAGTIGFAFAGTTYLYNSAYDRSWAHLAPGMVLVAEDIRLAIEDGCRGFDLLKGDYAYKYRFGAVRRRIRRLTVSRGG
ncbi:MAG: hypothetical protein KatS3mg013_0637 [Actinomycetota bacterium]|nr:MAG: hypothetical protein KatS3mg013_0637 [Actinomycetota bacterium]